MMNQNDELAAVKRKIRALTAKTIEAGATEAEAVAAMEKVGELLETFNLNLNEVFLKAETYTKKTFEIGSKHMGIFDYVAVAIGDFTETKTWSTVFYSTERRRHERALVFFGLESDVEMALYLTNIIGEAFKTTYAEFKASDDYRSYVGHRRSLHANFLRGFGSRLSKKLRSLKTERENMEKEAAAYHAEQMKDNMIDASAETVMKEAEATTGTALMVIAKEKARDAEFAKMGMKLYSRSSSNSYNYNSAGNTAGRNAAETVNLNRPINNSGRQGVRGYLK